jgi:uncharacterized protein YkwD
MSSHQVSPRRRHGLDPSTDRVSVPRRCSRFLAAAAALIALQSVVAVAPAAGNHRVPARGSAVESLHAIATVARHHLAHVHRSTSLASCTDASLVPTRANLARVEVATLCLVNVQRARRGRRALRTNGDLARSAVEHSQDMVAKDYFDHVSPAGETPLDRVAAGGYLPRSGTYVVGENIAVGTVQLATPAAIVSSWMASRDHRANILNRDFRDSGLGIVAQAPGQYAAGLPGATYTQEFGVIAR